MSGLILPDYIEIIAETDHEHSDDLAVFMIELGSAGVSVADREDAEELLRTDRKWDYVDSELMSSYSDSVIIRGYYPQPIQTVADALWQAAEQYAIRRVITNCEVRDYSDEWKKYYEVIEFERVAIVPLWKEYHGKNVPVFLDPGLAFGTGQHATTALCLKLIEQYITPDSAALDVGSGSGILGISALKLCARACDFIDIDEDALKSSRENAVHNEVSDRCGYYKEIPKNKYDIVFASIIADVLIELLPQIKEAVRPGGTVILSGILNTKRESVFSAYKNAGFELIDECAEGDWLAAVYRA